MNAVIYYKCVYLCTGLFGFMKGCAFVIKKENHIGKITVSRRYLKKLIGKTVTNCFGVVGMNEFGPKQCIMSMINGTSLDNGVVIYEKDNAVRIDLHIAVSYGVNISAISDSIVHKVRFAVENEAGIEVEKVNVYIDSMQS